MFTFSQQQIDDVAALRDAGSYADAYRLAAGWAEGGEGVSQASIVWMRGTADANQNIGPESAFVRAYTASLRPPRRSHPQKGRLAMQAGLC